MHGRDRSGGGPVTLLEAILFEHGERMFHVRGVAVNWARDAYRGEAKSDPRDARIIAGRLRLRWRSLGRSDARIKTSPSCGRWPAIRETSSKNRPGVLSPQRDTARGVPRTLEVALDLTNVGALLALTKVARPVSVRKLGKARLERWLKSQGVRKADLLAETMRSAAQAQRHELPAAKVRATLVTEIASEILRSKERLAALETRLKELVAANPKGNIIRTLPGIGVVLTAGFLAEIGDLGRLGSADQLAAAAGVAPVLRSSGAIAYRRRARRANKAL